MSKEFGKLEKELEEELYAMIDEINTLKGMAKAYERIASRLDELKWLANMYNLQDFEEAFSRLESEAISRKKKVSELITKYGYAVEDLRKKARVKDYARVMV